MSISSALYSSFAGLRQSTAQISVTSQNVTNADRPGYTRKELVSSYQTTNAGTVAINSRIETVNYNIYMLASLIEDSSVATREQTIADYLSVYARELGSIDGDNTISAYINNFTSSLDELTITPEDSSLKGQVVANAGRITSELNRLSTNIQDARLQADKEIEQTVIEINDLLSQINDLNTDILQNGALGGSVANLEDERNIALERLSELIDFDYFTNSNNQLQIYTAGRPLLDSRAREIEYTAANNLDKTVVYPGGFNAIDLDGFDLTTRLVGGEIKGLIDVRDTFLVQEQDKLDALAASIIESVNDVLSEGTSLPPRNSMVGPRDGGIISTTPLAATGIFTIGTMGDDGVVVSSAVINVGTTPTAGDLITALNLALPGDITAGLNASDQFTLTGLGGNGIFVDAGTAQFGANNQNFLEFFGLNNLFDGAAADDISVSSYLTADSATLATARVTSTTIGDQALSIGDSSLTADILDTFTADFSYNIAGNFAAQDDKIINYVDKIISDIAYRASNAETDATIRTQLKDQTRTTLQNLSGVNIDEEMANLVDLQAKYEASATMISTLQEMFDTLLGAVR